jgi:hypothetical protein
MLENTDGSIKMDIPEKLTTYGRQSEETKITTQYVLDTTIRTQTQIRSTRDEPSYKQLVVKTNLTSLLCKIRNGHHITKLRTQTHNKTTHKNKKKYHLCNADFLFTSSSCMHYKTSKVLKCHIGDFGSNWHMFRQTPLLQTPSIYIKY